MVLFVLAAFAGLVVAAGLALIAISILTFVAALIAGQMRTRSRNPHHRGHHAPRRLIHRHH